jgi:hypothetical protein
MSISKAAGNAAKNAPIRPLRFLALPTMRRRDGKLVNEKDTLMSEEVFQGKGRCDRSFPASDVSRLGGTNAA